MGYAVYHMEKGKSGSGGIGNHIDRKEGMEHTFRHADPSRQKENINFPVHENRHEIPMAIAVNQRIDEGYNKKRKIRTDSVKFMTHILTGSHEEMNKIFADPLKKKAWINANRAFIENEFGAKNIVRFSLHLDERTPHIHAVTVPLLEDGRLSANEIIGNKASMQSRQDRYAEMMKPFDLERGLKRTGIKHEDAQQYYARISKANEVGKNIGHLTSNKRLFGRVVGIDKDNTIKQLKTALIDSKTSHKADKLELKAVRKHLDRVKAQSNITAEKLHAIVHNDHVHQDAQGKRIQELQNHIRHEVGRSISYNRKVMEVIPGQMDDLIYDPAIKAANGIGTNQEIFDKAMSQDFKSKLWDIVQQKADKNIKQFQKRGNNRGFGY